MLSTNSPTRAELASIRNILTCSQDEYGTEKKTSHIESSIGSDYLSQCTHQLTNTLFCLVSKGVGSRYVI